ncbi:MAG TPA: hypothetical protein G4O00_07445 [Thermoflexia bacterium]|jgi:hypothetical protein|nr:hypothetical protein [Thermoflexia bacterium]
MGQETVLVLMVGGGGQSPVEGAIRRAREAAACDLLEAVFEAGCAARAIVATDDPHWVEPLLHLPVELDLDPPGDPFHFGRRLADLIRRHRLEAVLYAGGGSAPLMSAAAWREALAGFAAGRPMVVTNNLHSSDWVALRPAERVLSLIAEQERDNGLAWALVHEAGLPVRTLPPSASSRFDLDTPADLLIAWVHPGTPPRLRRVLAGLGWSKEAVEGILRVMGQEGGHLAVIGRSSSAAWAALEEATRCWVRMFVEERGMIASGRLRRGEVRSLLAEYLEEVGVEGFFSTLSDLVDGVLMDNRVILAACGRWPSRSDRFSADLFRWWEVDDSFLQAFARAAAEVEIPLLVGGQSVVSGGLLALVEILQERRGG